MKRIHAGMLDKIYLRGSTEGESYYSMKCSLRCTYYGSSEGEKGRSYLVEYHKRTGSGWGPHRHRVRLWSGCPELWEEWFCYRRNKIQGQGPLNCPSSRDQTLEFSGAQRPSTGPVYPTCVLPYTWPDLGNWPWRRHACVNTNGNSFRKYNMTSSRDGMCPGTWYGPAGTGGTRVCHHRRCRWHLHHHPLPSSSSSTSSLWLAPSPPPLSSSSSSSLW